MTKRFDLAGRPVLVFFVKLIVIYGAWYALYHGWLRPHTGLDAAVAHYSVTMADGLLRGLGRAPLAEGRVLRLPGAVGVKVEDGCNGLSIIGLFVGFVCAFPGRWRRRLLFLPVGALVIYAANVARVGSLAYLQRAWPAGFETLHSVSIPAFFYLLVLGLWMAWANLGGAGAAPSTAPSPKPI